VWLFVDDAGRQDAGDGLGGDPGDHWGAGSKGVLPSVAAGPGETRQTTQLGTYSC